LNKYVGETERQIRLILQRAKEKSDEGVPVIVFFDEMDSLFRTRGTGVSSDVESTIVPQLLSELDGVEALKNVIVIGASNREDLIDPAILRPGRLDVKIKIQRPSREAAREIFRIYLEPDLPYDRKELKRYGDETAPMIDHLVDVVVDKMYEESEDNRFLEVTYANGDREVLYFKDFASGGDDREHHQASQEGCDQARDRGRSSRPQDERCRERSPTGVPRARGSTEHDQS